MLSNLMNACQLLYHAWKEYVLKHFKVCKNILKLLPLVANRRLAY